MAEWNRRDDGCIVNDPFCGSFEYCDECKREIRHRRRMERKRMENDQAAAGNQALASLIVAAGVGLWAGIGALAKSIKNRKAKKQPEGHVVYL